MNTNRKIFYFIFLVLFTVNLFSQGILENQIEVFPLPLKKVVILTSGLAYYEHSGTVSGSLNFAIPFRLNAMNDALKTLIINDPGSANPSVTYQSENTLIETLRSLSVDISDSPDLATILSRLRGEEVLVVNLEDDIYTGRIAGLERRSVFYSDIRQMQAWLLLNTNDGLLSVNLEQIKTIKFTNPDIERDLNRSLDLISASRNSFSRQLLINLPGNSLSGTARRNVVISYVIPSPVWKVSYRLDLGASSLLFQGWAIVDNDSDTDWNNIELSLVAGRPSSFIQELYPPYFVSRPVRPLAIAGTAEAVTHERSMPAVSAAPRPESQMMRMSVQEDSAMMFNSGAGNITGGTIQTAAGNETGGQFEFTIRNPVTLNRRMSAMFPLVEANIEARKTLIYNGSGRFPRLGAELTNTSRMKLPAGPVTVYDGGVYAGDALIDFWNENEKRFISFGEDLSVTASMTPSLTRAVSTVTISGGVMIIHHHHNHIRTYNFLNSGSASKQMVIEHSRTANTELISPSAAEQTPLIYRFNTALPANQETVVTVNERQVVSERITLAPMRIETLLSYSTNQEIPANVRTALTRAIELRRTVETSEANVRNIETQRNSLIADQDRVRRNLEAVGNQSSQGQEYLRRLVELDNQIDLLSANLERARSEVITTRTAFENYLNNLQL